MAPAAMTAAEEAAVVAVATAGTTAAEEEVVTAVATPAPAPRLAAATPGPGRLHAAVRTAMSGGMIAVGVAARRQGAHRARGATEFTTTDYSTTRGGTFIRQRRALGALSARYAWSTTVLRA